MTTVQVSQVLFTTGASSCQLYFKIGKFSTMTSTTESFDTVKLMPNWCQNWTLPQNRKFHAKFKE